VKFVFIDSVLVCHPDKSFELSCVIKRQIFFIKFVN